MIDRRSFAFRYSEPLPYMLLDSIGWQTTDTDNYHNNGHTRTDHGHIIFQYTISGEGRFRFEDRLYTVTPGQAFLARVPSSHAYYYEHTDGTPWEFLYLNAKGEDAVRLWDRILAARGPILTLPPSSAVLTRFWELYHAVAVKQVSDPAALSSMLYNWMLTLLDPRIESSGERESRTVLDQAKAYIRDRYAEPLTLQDIAQHCGVSSSYLCRLFRRWEPYSPLESVRRRRTEAAVAMLRRTDLPIHEIGRRCGFESPSYFGKVFRSYLSVSPGEYRERGMEYPFDTVFLD